MGAPRGGVRPGTGGSRFADRRRERAGAASGAGAPWRERPPGEVASDVLPALNESREEIRGPSVPEPTVDPAAVAVATPPPVARAHPPGVRLAEIEEVEVVVDRLVAGGDGLARWEGIPIFVPRSAPGDRVRARLVERRPDYGRAEIVELLSPGPRRREPPCPYFVRCGGCDLQHLEDDYQVELKAAAFAETLARIGHVTLERPPERVAGAPFGYRLRTQLQVRRVEERSEVGYFTRGSHDLVAIDRCPILVPELESVLPSLPEALGDDAPVRLDLTVGDDGSLSSAPVVEGLPHGEVRATIGDFVYTYDARCFFQAHRGLLPELVQRVVGEWSGARAVDLYAGVGLFSLPLARRYGAVTAVEGERLSVRYARANARHNHVAVEIVAQAVESWVSRLPADLDRVIVDPPRAGLALPVRDALVERPPARLTYVSCHAAALARDLRDLAKVYRVESVTLLDLFPQSGHLEAVVQLVRI